MSCSIVYAGLEPIEFTNLFPQWTIHSKARQQNLSVREHIRHVDIQIDIDSLQEGKRLHQKDAIPDILKHLCREQYTIEELRARPLPEGKFDRFHAKHLLTFVSLGVDPSKIEFYLSDDEFQVENIQFVRCSIVVCLIF
jgi:supervillin